MFRRAQAGVVIVLVFTSLCFSATPHSFLTIPPFARATGIAGAYTSLSEGTYGLFYNPAGIPSVMGFEAQLSWVPWLQSMQYFHLALINPYQLFGFGKIGASVAWVQADRQAAAGKNYIIDWGTYPLTVDSVSNIQAVLGMGFDIFTMFSAGINMKLVYEYISDGTKAYNYGLDIGLLAKFEMPGHFLRMGAIASNAGPELISSNTGFEPPAKITVGISDEFDFMDSKLLISADTVFSTDMKALFKIGFEYWPFNFLSLRAGYKIAAFNHPAFGAGLKFDNMSLYYAFEEYENAGSTHAVSFIYSWGTPPVGIKAEPGLISPNNDGVLERTVIMPLIPQKGKVKAVRLIIYSQNGKKIYEKAVADKYSKALEWNGKTGNAAVPDGVYNIELEAEYMTNGSSRSKLCAIIVDNTPPAPLLVRDLTKSGVLDLPLVLVPSASDESPLAGWVFRIFDSAGKDFFVQRGTGRLPQVFEWNGFGPDNKKIKNGQRYMYSLKAADMAGNAGESETEEYLYAPAKKAAFFNFSSDALFEKGEASVKTSSFRSLKTLKDNIKKYPGAEIVIFGHTDNKETAGSYKTRLKLSKARANAVKYYLENLLGVKKGYILTQGYGDSMPVAKEDTEEARAKNRRVEVIIQTKIYK